METIRDNISSTRSDDDNIMILCTTPFEIASSNGHDRRSDQNDEKNITSLSLSSLSFNPSQMSVSVSSLLNSPISSNSQAVNTTSSNHSNHNIDCTISSSGLISSTSTTADTKNNQNNTIKESDDADHCIQENNGRLHTISSSNSSEMTKEDQNNSPYSMNIITSSHGSQSFLNVGRNLMMQQHQQEHERNCNINMILPDHLIHLEHVISDQLLLDIIESELNIEDCDILENPFLFLSSFRRDDDTTTLLPIREPPLLSEKEKVQYKSYHHRHSDKKRREIIPTRMKEITLSSFPKEFTCPLCEDLIVGSITLNCGCHRSTFCITCLEEEFHHQINKVKNDRQKEDGGFVIVSMKNLLQQQYNENKYCCPSCNCNVIDATPCHTIDVAVLHAVRNFNKAMYNNNIDSDEIDAFQSMYYLRLQQWIDTFHSRCKEANDNKKYRLLQKFIDEQKILIEECEKRNQCREAVFTNSCEAIVVAALIGINVFLFRKWTFK